MRILHLLTSIFLCYYAGKYAASNNMSVGEMMSGAMMYLINYAIWTIVFCFYLSNTLGCLFALPIVIYKCFFKRLPILKIFLCVSPIVSWNLLLFVIFFSAGYFNWIWLLKSVDSLSCLLAFWLSLAQVLYQFLGPDRRISYSEMKRLWAND